MMDRYFPRIADTILRWRLQGSGAVLVQGAKWCGKTTTAARCAKSILYMQDPDKVEQNLRLASLKPSKLLEGETPHLLDEWQMAPKLWDAVRFAVDQRNEKGQFILTGSAVPPDDAQIFHSGVGRISRMLMRPMTLYESKESTGEVSLAELFKQKQEVEGTSRLSFDDLAFVICRGGWPSAVMSKGRVALQQAYDYYDGVVEVDLYRLDGVERNVRRLQRLMRSYARFIGTQSKFTELIKDMSSNEVGCISDVTLASYVSALKKIFVIDDVMAWNVNLRSKTAIRTSDTRYFVDPSVAVAALRLGPEDLINDLRYMGFLFENLCIRDLKVYAEALDGDVYHYRDADGLECDAVIHLRNGKYGLIEIKLGGDEAVEAAAKTLNTLNQKLDVENVGQPSFKVIVIGVGDYAYTRTDGIYVVPIGCLKN